VLVDAVLPVDAVEFVSVAPDVVSVALADAAVAEVQTDEALAVLADAAVAEAQTDEVSVAFVDAVLLVDEAVEPVQTGVVVHCEEWVKQLHLVE
jgi:predicted NAD/FAD-binding protein